MADETNEATAETTASTKAAVNKVTMKDGRTVEFVGKRRMLKESYEENGAVTTRIDFANGETVLFVCPATLLALAAGHGMEQKLGDEAAGEKDIDDAFLAVESLAKRLTEKGVEGWRVAREPGSGMTGMSVLLKALIEVYSNKTPEELKAFLSTKSLAEKIALRNSSKLKPVVERLEAEKAAGASAKVNTEELLSALG